MENKKLGDNKDTLFYMALENRIPEKAADTTKKQTNEKASHKSGKTTTRNGSAARVLSNVGSLVANVAMIKENYYTMDPKIAKSIGASEIKVYNITNTKKTTNKYRTR